MASNLLIPTIGLQEGAGADLVVSFFAMHYAFGNNTSITQFVKNISKLLKYPHSKFIGICFDKNAVMKLLTTPPRISNLISTDDKVSMYTNNSFDKKLLWSIELKNENTISVHTATFFKEQIEYLVDFVEFERKLREFGLKLEKIEPFNTMKDSEKLPFDNINYHFSTLNVFFVIAKA